MTITAPADDRFTVPSDWVRNIIEILQPDPRLLGDVLAAAGLHWSELREPGQPIAQRKEVALIHALTQRFGDTSYAAELGLKLSGRTSTVVSYVLHSSRTLAEAMANIQRIIALTRPGARVTFVRGEETGEWELDNLDPWVRESPIYMEFITSVILAGFRTATGRPVRPLSISLRKSARNSAPRLSHLWECPVSTEEDRHRIIFSSLTLDTPLTNFDAPLLNHLKTYSDLLLQETPEVEPGLRLSVERSILNHLSGGAPPIAKVAEELGLSARTLTRRLGEEGLSYRALLEDVRRRKAELMLRESTVTLAEIAFLLGYSEQSSFTNAFRRWTGQAPGTYRSQWREQDLAPPAPMGIDRAGQG